MSNVQPLEMTVPEITVRSSIQIFLADKNDPRPVGFGSGCILYHRDRYFLVSVRHVTDYDGLTTFLETGIPVEEENTIDTIKSTEATAPENVESRRMK